MDRFCIQAHCQSEIKLNEEATGESLCAVPGSDCLSGAQAFRIGCLASFSTQTVAVT